MDITEAIDDLTLLTRSESKVEKFSAQVSVNGSKSQVFLLGSGVHTAVDALAALDASNQTLQAFGGRIESVYFQRFDG